MTENTNRETLKSFRAEVRTRLDSPLKTGEPHAPDRLAEELTELVKAAQTGPGARVNLGELGDVLGSVALHLRLAK